jgi:hypothetical protein
VPFIFVSYRREDTRWVIGRLYDRLEARFGKGSVFVDVEAIPPGNDFRTHIAKVLQACKVVLVIIGPRWIGPNGHGASRIVQPDDWARIEIEIAIEKHLPIIPILVDRTPMPQADDLPPSVRSLAYFQAAPLDTEKDFEVHAARIVRAVARHLGSKPRLKKKKKWLLIAAATALAVASLAAYVLLQPSPTGSEAQNGGNIAAIQACGAELALPCARQGGLSGAKEALAGLAACKNGVVVRSDDAALRWKDVWTTSVYSYAPGGGGPGGGRDDDELKVGGWGDWYFSLIRFELPQLQARPAFAALALYAKRGEFASVPLAVDRIIQRWEFPKGDRLWWKDRPGARAVSADFLPAPPQERWYAIDLTGLIQEWFDGRSPNYGIQIRPASNFGSIVVFVSSDAADKAKIPRLIFCR